VLLLAATLICADCHRELAERYQRTPMANTSGTVRASAEHSGKVDTRYTITPQLRLIWGGGHVDLTLFIGSRRMGRTYAYQRDGHLFQAPVGYYANRSAWDLAPGYEHDDAPDLNRPITADCLFCHATRASLVEGTINRYSQIHPGIQCERCHGDASNHQALVNPRRLTPRLRDSVCEQCHLSGEVRLTHPGKRTEDFRPGQNLADYVEVFVTSAKGVKVNGHAEALAASPCKQASGDRLWCGTCHNPHQAIDASAACQVCHKQSHHQQQSCTGCHMPKSKAYDGGHTVFTDHTIASGRQAGELVSYFQRQAKPRDLGLAYVEMAARLRETKYLERAWPLLREAAASKPRDPALYRAIASLLEADGRKEQAIAYYRISLDQDPLQPDGLHRLATLVGGAEARKLREKASQILPRPF